MPSSRPGYVLATTCWPILPPEHPCPIVYRTPPYDSRMCSFSISTASALTTLFAFLPWMFSELFATMNPRESALSSRTVVGVDCLWYGAVLCPNGSTSLWFHARGDAHGAVGAFGSARTPMS